MLFWGAHGPLTAGGAPASIAAPISAGIPAAIAAEVPSPFPAPAGITADVTAWTVLAHLVEVVFALDQQGFACQAEFEGGKG